MRSIVAALILAASLVGAGAAVSLLGSSGSHDAAPVAPASHHAAAAPSAHGHGAGAHAYEGGSGTIPDLVTAMTALDRRTQIVISNDSQFNPAAGVRSGTGTFEDPFVISGWYVDTILIRDTSKAFEIKGNYVSNILILDWTGQGGYVHHNHLENMRTNRNVARTGDPSATVIENNLILKVEQLRHFDGEVRNNTIGDAYALPMIPFELRQLPIDPDNGKVTFDIAGLNGAGIHDNLIYGGVDMKIHGHHHSDAPGSASHNHGTPDPAASDAPADGYVEDHQMRYVDFEFFNNHIIDNGFGLRYNDLNHAGDDRQATSEQEPALELPHVHHTKINIHDNVIEGATLRIAVVNSGDERHLPGESAELILANNTIASPHTASGINVAAVQDAVVRIFGNKVQESAVKASTGSAILLAGFKNSTVYVGDNAFGAWTYGIRASGFDAKTHWVVLHNDDSAVKTPLYWDSSVANPPERGDGTIEPAHDHEHDHGHEADSAADGKGTSSLSGLGTSGLA